MIALLKGILESKSHTEVIVNCGGVGYCALISLNTFEKLPDEGASVRLLTILQPREDSLTLYAFIESTEKEAFKLLLAIPGVGGKTALAILSSTSPLELQQHILSGNLPALQKLPGIGKKTAERIIVELRDKITKLEISHNQESDILISRNFLFQEALAAMITLGYSKLTAEKSLKKVLTDTDANNLTVEKILRLALKVASK